MPITVEFRGVMLFVANGQNLQRILIPSAGADTIPPEGQRGQHADGTVARPHHAGLLILKANGAIDRRVEPLSGTVTIRQSGGTNCGLKDFDLVVGLDKVANSSKPNDLRLLEPSELGARVAATLILEGGDVRSTTQSDLKWDLTKRFNGGHPYTQKQLTYRTTWHPGAGSVTVELVPPTPELPEAITLGDGQKVYVYNFDAATPGPPQLDRSEHCTPNEPDGWIEDHDFKWLFQLVRPKQGTLKDWINQPANAEKRLPAPRANCAAVGGPAAPGPAARSGASGPVAGARAPNVSTCFPGCWKC